MSSIQHQIPVDDSGNPIIAEKQTEESTNTEVQKTDRPSWLPENFKSPEDLAKSYDELRKQYTKASQELSELKKKSQPPSQQVTENSSEVVDEARKTVESVGLDFNSFAEEFYEKGELSEESLKLLEDKGIPREFVNRYIESAKVLQSVYTQEAINAVGGESNFQAMAEWAQANKAPEELDAYNRAVTSGDKNQMLLAVKGMYSDYIKENGQEPNLVKATTTSDSGTYFRSKAELVEAMKDPRYDKDPAYRQEVLNKLAKSKNVYKRLQ